MLPLGVYVAGRSLFRYGGPVALGLLTILIGVTAAGYLEDRTEANLRYWTTQAYAPSGGGVASVQETSAFLAERLAPDERFFAVPDVEFTYYSRREAIWDYRVYFLPDERLREVFADMGVSYVVLPLSARQPDELWNHAGKAPLSFVERVKGDVSARLYDKGGRR